MDKSNDPSLVNAICDIPIILLSGMAADERLFGAQLVAFPTLRIQHWVDPEPRESLRSYAARLALLVNPGCPCIVGGASFGGVVAMEMAPHLPSLACILIGSIRSPSGLPWRLRLLWPLAMLGPGALQAVAAFTARLGGLFLTRSAIRRLQRLSQPESFFVAWAICSLLRWTPSPAIAQVPVFHVHGSADDVLPVSLSQPDEIVPGGRHALPLFDPSAVNAFIADVVRQVASHV